jgi:hypothetical protein
MERDLGLLRRRAACLIAVNTNFNAEDFERFERLELSAQDLRHIVLCDQCRRGFVDAWKHVYGTLPNCRNSVAGFARGGELPPLTDE